MILILQMRKAEAPLKQITQRCPAVKSELESGLAKNYALPTILLGLCLGKGILISKTEFMSI